MTINFDPNNKKPPTYEWASYIPTRSTQPKFKPHRTRAHCLSAFTYGQIGVAYHWNGDEWKEVFRREREDPVPTHCQICGNDLRHYRKRFDGSDIMYISGRWTWINKEKFFPDQIRICYSCKIK